MKTLYLDCSMGAAGDMLAAALLQICENSEQFIDRFNTLGLNNVTVFTEKCKKCGISACRFIVKIGNDEEELEHCEHLYEHHHHDKEKSVVYTHDYQHTHTHIHRGLNDIEETIKSLNISDKVKHDVISIYNIIAEAEARVHDTELSQVHFHELGSMDAIADITAVSMLLNEIGAEKILSSPVNLGSGTVKCAHGILPVPAPATAEILLGMPIYATPIKSELCTPTGAALLKYYVDGFFEMPPMCVTKIGRGAGKKDFERANIVTAYLGNTNKEQIVNSNFKPMKSDFKLA